MNQDIFLVIALGFLIVMMFLSSRKRKKAAAALQSDLKRGSSVVLHSGIMGVVSAIDGDKITIESTPGTSLLVLKGAVRSVEAPAAKTPVAKAAASKAPASKASASAAKPAVAKKPVVKKPVTKPVAK